MTVMARINLPWRGAAVSLWPNRPGGIIRRSIGGCGGTGRRAWFRSTFFGVGVRVPPAAPTGERFAGNRSKFELQNQLNQALNRYTYALLAASAAASAFAFSSAIEEPFQCKDWIWVSAVSSWAVSFLSGIIKIQNNLKFQRIALSNSVLVEYFESNFAGGLMNESLKKFFAEQAQKIGRLETIFSNLQLWAFYAGSLAYGVWFVMSWRS